VRDNKGFLLWKACFWETTVCTAIVTVIAETITSAKYVSGSTISQNNIWHYLAGNESNYD